MRPREPLQQRRSARRPAAPPRRRRPRPGRSAPGRASRPRRSRRGRSAAAGSGPVELLGALAALGEDEHELAPRRSSRRCTLAGCAGTPPIFGSSMLKPGIALEEVLDREVQRARARVLLLDRLGDHRRVGRQRAGVVGDQQRAAVGRDVLDALDLAAEPQVVEEVVERAVEEPSTRSRAAPVGRPGARARSPAGSARRSRSRVGEQRRRLGVVGARRRASSAVGARERAGSLAHRALLRPDGVAPGARTRRRSADHGSSLRRQLGPVGAQTMPSLSQTSRFHGCPIVAAAMPAVDGAPEVHRAVVDQQVDADLAAARDLVVASSTARRTAGRCRSSHARGGVVAPRRRGGS